MTQSTHFRDPFLSETVPFLSAQEAWFWFVDAQEALSSGAFIRAGASATPRPCEPADIMALLTRLHKNRQLKWEQIKILHHYGIRKMAPDPYRPKEKRAYILWRQALSILEEHFIRKGIIEKTAIAKDWMKMPHGGTPAVENINGAFAS